MVTGSPGEPNAYDRGVKAGKIDQQLASHGQRLDTINGSIERVADRLASLDVRAGSIEMMIQRLEDQMISAATMVTNTAKALRDADDMRRKSDEAARSASDRRWTPMQRVITIISVLLVAVGVIVAIIALR